MAAAVTGLSRAQLDGPIAAAAAGALRSWRFRVWLGITTAVGVGLTQLPLVGVLGFELALVASLVAAIAAIDLGAALARRAQSEEMPTLAVATSPLRLVAALAVRAAGLAVLVALSPGAIAAIHGIWARTCDWWFGIECYLAMPIATAILFAGLGVAVGLLTGPRRRVLGNALPYLVVLAIAGWGLWRFYAAPPVFSYNPIIGYFPGNLYDENVELRMPLVWARLETLAAVIGVLGLCAARLDAPRLRVGARAVRPLGLRGPAWITALVGLGVATGLHLASGRLGHGIGADDIVDELAGRTETPHFVIHHARTPEILRDLAVIVADHELRYAQVVARIGGVAPSGKIHSYYFASRDQKARWMGARDVEMAKPWRREIYLDHRPFPHGSLRHEIAHVVAGAFGDPVFGVSTRRVLGLPVLINPGLIEGFAVAVDWPGGYDRSITPHQAMRVMQVIGKEPTVDELLSLRFLSLASARSYMAAGSFLRFLLDRYGATPMRALYESGGDFEAAYGKRQRALVVEWREFLTQVDVPLSAIEGNRERLSRGSVFERPCPHAIAKQRSRAYERLADGDRRDAIALLREVCRDAPEPRNQIDLADMLFVEGSERERAEARAIWTALAGGDVTTPVRAEAQIRLGDLAAARGDWAGAMEHAMAAIALPLDDSQRRLVVVRWLVLTYPGPAGPVLRSYYYGIGGGHRSLPPIAAGVEPGLGLTHYLAALRSLDDDDHAGASRALQMALDRGLPSALFVRNAARKLAVAAFRAKDAAGIARAIAVLGDAAMPEVDRLLAVDWRERWTFTQTGRL